MKSARAGRRSESPLPPAGRALRSRGGASGARLLDRARGACLALAGLAVTAPACEPRPSYSATRKSGPRPSAASAPPPVAAAQPALTRPAAASAEVTSGPGFPAAGPWVSFYGSAEQLGDLARVARTFRIINLDADPGTENFTDEQLQVLKAGGQNRVLSYLNVGACEHDRTYWSIAPAGLSPCAANRAAQRGAYKGYPGETWMDPGDPSYQQLLLEYVAPRLAARVDGFYLDNLELLEHSAGSTNGPCSPSCRQGGLDFVRRLREKFPGHLIVMQNATSAVTRLGVTGGVRFATLLDGIAHEEVYAPKYDGEAEAELLAWKGLNLKNRDGRPLWIAVEDYVGSCSKRQAALAALAKARAREFSPYISDKSGGQQTICYWQ